jgi:hypothetical protein
LYRKLLKTKYSHDGDERLDQRGFLELVRDKVNENEKLAWRAFRNWGYDEDLYPVQARSFVLTIHSAHFIKLSVEDTVKDQGSL